MSFEGRDTSERPEIEFTADVRIRELHFDAVPDPEVGFSGHPERKSDWRSERENLPDRVKPGVVYRNAAVRLLIASETTTGVLERERSNTTTKPPEQKTANEKPEIEEEQE